MILEKLKKIIDHVIEEVFYDNDLRKERIENDSDKKDCCENSKCCCEKIEKTD